MPWYEDNQGRWENEKDIASKLLVDVSAGIDDAGTAFIRGTLDVFSQHGHLYESVRLRIEYPAEFPSGNRPPSIFLESHRDRWEKGEDSHIESDWKLCLFVPGDSGIDFTNTGSLNDLFAIIHTFLFKERVYQKRRVRAKLFGGVAKWPGEDRSHGVQGIREAIDEMGGVGRNELCPCGSGQKFKKCHMRQLEQ